MSNFNPHTDPEEYAAEQAEFAEREAVHTYDEAIEKGWLYMDQARIAFAKATTMHLRVEGMGVDFALANYLQSRALTFFQIAALLKP